MTYDQRIIVWVAGIMAYGLCAAVTHGLLVRFGVDFDDDDAVMTAVVWPLVFVAGSVMGAGWVALRVFAPISRLVSRVGR